MVAPTKRFSEAAAPAAETVINSNYEIKSMSDDSHIHGGAMNASAGSSSSSLASGKARSMAMLSPRTGRRLRTSKTSLASDERRDDPGSPEEDNISIVSSTNTYSRPLSTISTYNFTSRVKDESFRWKKEAERWQDQYEKALYTHEKTIAVLEERISRLDSLLQTSIKEKNTFSALAASREKEISDLLHRQTMLKANLEKSEKSSISLQEKVSKSQTLQKKVDDLEKQQGKIRSQADKKYAHVERLAKERDELKAIVEGLKSQVGSLTEERGRLERTASEAELSRDQLAAQTKELEEAVQRATEEGLKREQEAREQLGISLKEAEEREERLAREKADLEVRLEALRAALATARQERDRDLATLRDLEAKLAAAQADMSDAVKLREELKELRAAENQNVKEVLLQLEELQKEHEAILAERDQLSKSKRTTDEETLTLRQSVVELTAARQDLKLRLQQMEQIHEASSVEYQDIIESLRGTISRLQHEHGDALSSQSGQVRELSEHLGSALELLEARQAELDAALAREELLAAQVEVLTKALTAAKDELEAGWERIRELEEGEAGIRAERDELRSHLSMASRALAEKEREARDTAKRFEKLEGELNVRKEALAKAESALELERRRFEDRLAEEEARLADISEQLEDEKRYRDGERNMSEIRLAQIRAEAGDHSKHLEEKVHELQQTLEASKAELAERVAEQSTLMEKHRHEMGQLRYDLVEMEEVMREYRERCYDAEQQAEDAAAQVQELRDAIARQGEAFEARDGETSAKLAELEEKLADALRKRDDAARELEEVRRLGHPGSVEHNAEIAEAREAARRESERAEAQSRRTRELEAEITKAMENLAELRGQAKVAEVRIRDLEREVEKSNSELRDAILQHDRDLAAHKLDLDQMSALLVKADQAYGVLEASSRETISKLQRSIKEERGLRETAEAEREEEKTARERSEAKLREALEMLDAERAACRAARGLAKELEATLETARRVGRASHDGLAAEIEEEREARLKAWGTVRQEVDEVRGRAERLAKELREERERSLAAEREARDERAKREELERIIAKLREEVGGGPSNEDGEVTPGRRRRESLSERNRRLEREVELLTKAVAEGVGARRDKDDRIKELGDELAEAKLEIDRLRSQSRSKSKARSINGESYHADSTNDDEDDNGLSAEVAQRLQKYFRDAKDREAEVRRLSSDIESLREQSKLETTRLEAEIQRLRKEIGDKERELASLREGVKVERGARMSAEDGARAVFVASGAVI
ncbi:hypothetical protein HDU96_000319 [Phlyctochytrium bullatum]|nr:hypothetical protein HDU96_000319 [Phlyctochytrium bullatum]